MNDPQELQIVEHRLRMLQEQLKQAMAKVHQHRQEEGRIRCDMQNLENRKANLLGSR